MQSTPTLAILAALLLVSACVPEPLEGLEDAGDNTNGDPMNNDMGTVNSNTTTGSNGGTGSFDTEFVAVSQILTSNCASTSGCHDAGNMPFATSAFQITGGSNAEPGAVQSAIDGVSANTSPNMLIAPNSAAMSEIYIRITKESDDPQLMGQGAFGAAADPLPADQITTIESWINNGANYMQ